MKSNVLRLCVWALLPLSLWFAASAAQACSVPVFRYALDRWPADSYRLEMAAGATADPALSHLLRNLGDDSPMNLKVVARDGIGPTESRLCFPRDEATVWSGVLDAAAFAQLTNSPARAEIVRRLLSGESAVWVLIESGQRDLDKSEAARLEKRLAFLETVAVLPRIDPTDPTSRFGPGPELRIKFSALRLAAGDTRESVLRTMLLGPKQDPETTTGEPIAVLVFGRGRVLGAWPMKDLGDESIDEACLYLLGACSCQVKQLNPGWDLLLSVDWDRALQTVAAGRVFETDSEKALAPRAAVESITIQPQMAPALDEGEADRSSPGILMGLAGAAVLLTSVFLWRRYR